MAPLLSLWRNFCFTNNNYRQNQLAVENCLLVLYAGCALSTLSVVRKKRGLSFASALLQKDITCHRLSTRWKILCPLLQLWSLHSDRTRRTGRCSPADREGGAQQMNWLHSYHILALFALSAVHIKDLYDWQRGQPEDTWIGDWHRTVTLS